MERRVAPTALARSVPITPTGDGGHISAARLVILCANFQMRVTASWEELTMKSPKGSVFENLESVHDSVALLAEIVIEAKRDLE